MKILVLDNYDSFTYNLVHIVRELGYGDQMEVYRNDKIDLADVEQYDKILLSPGPGIPEEAGIMPELLKQYGPTKSILGICLGHQAIGEAFGAEIYNIGEVLHGIPMKNIVQKKDYLFEGLPQEFMGARYHSWAIKRSTLNGQLDLIASDENGEVMGVAHKEYHVRGLQFHPESVLTENGKQIIKNWLLN